jgi:hypothetical protein
MASGEPAWIARGETSEKTSMNKPVKIPPLRIVFLLFCPGIPDKPIPEDGKK